MSFKENLKEYFIFTKGESIGITVLIVILIVVIITNLFSEFFVKKKNFDFTKYEQLTDSLNSKSAHLALFEDFYQSDKLKFQYDTLNLFFFNPNKISEKQAEQLGLSDYQFKMIQKYLSSGGNFKYKSDFKKIYSVNDEQYENLYPYINLPDYKNNKTFQERNKISNKKKYNLFSFDPNKLPDKAWKDLGFSEKQISVIRKYINAGGKFYKKEDLKKMYVVNDEKYAELEPYINISEKENTVEKKIPEKRRAVDINNLSAEELKTYGKFWQYNATRIVKYRNLLGGYYKKEQLLEVYGVKKEYYNKITDDIVIDNSKIKKINVNFAEVSELGRHPYISYDEARKILEYRNQNGAYKSVEVIKKMKLIPPQVYERISPYLKVK